MRNLLQELPHAENDSQPNTTLPVTDVGWAYRLERSHRALNAWRHEARLPWADREMTVAIAETEIAALQNFMLQMPTDVGAEVPPLLHDWDEFRLTLLAT